MYLFVGPDAGAQSVRTAANKDALLELYLCGSRDLHQLIRRLTVAATQCRDLAPGLLAAQAALMRILWPDAPGEAGVEAA